MLLRCRDVTINTQALNRCALHITEGGGPLFGTVIVNGQRIAVTVERTLIGVSLSTDHHLALAQVDITGHDNIKTCLTGADTLGQLLPVGNGTYNEGTVLVRFRTTEVKGEVHLVHIVVPLAAAHGRGTVDAKDVHVGRYLYLCILGSRHPTPGHSSLTTDTIGDRLTLIAINHIGIDNLVAALLGFVLFLRYRGP